MPEEIPEEIQHTLQPQREISPFGDLKKLEEYLLNEREPIDYAKMVSPTTSVLALGETHRDISIRNEIMNHLTQLKSLGFTYFGMETFETDFQPILNEYQETGEWREEILNECKNNWPAGELYMQLVDVAKRARMRVVALDLPSSEKKQYKTTTEQLQKRDERMAQTVQAILNEDPENKIVTFTGNGHAGKSGFQMANLLANNGVNVVSVNINQERTNFETAARNIGAARERFMAACLTKFPNSPTPYDWMIHLPR
jgi:uncharacterized iron-regulated protein